MENVAKRSDGRRLFTAEFKREQVDRILRGEVTASELSRELGVARSLIQRWKHLATKGAEVAVLAADAMEPGVYRNRWDAKGMDSGVYFCKLETAGTTRTAKLLLVR